MIVYALLALAAAGQDTPSAQPTAAPAKPQKVCRTFEGNGGLGIGSIMPPSRICKTPDQWAKVDAKKSKSASQGS